MRQVIGGDGSDTTSAVVAYLAAHSELLLANLYMIGEPEDPAAVRLTDWESPLLWGPWGTFQPAVISRGQITSQVGLQVDTLDLSWSPPVSALGSSVATANPYQLSQIGFYDNKKVRLWRTLMPAAGDANTFGAYELFGGRVADSSVVRGKIKFTVNSFLDVVNQQVPPNTIEITNTLASYKGATPVLADGETVIAQFTCVAPSSRTSILGACTGPTPGKIYGDNKFQLGYLVWNAGATLAGLASRISNSNSYGAGGGVFYNQVVVYQPFPFDPTPGDTFYISTAYPVDQTTAGANGIGFPYVPSPETAI